MFDNVNGLNIRRWRKEIFPRICRGKKRKKNEMEVGGNMRTHRWYYALLVVVPEKYNVSENSKLFNNKEFSDENGPTSWKK